MKQLILGELKIHRVEVKNIIPPRDIQEAMEKQMRAERERREVFYKLKVRKQLLS